MAKTKDELGTTTPLPLEIHRAILGEVDSKRDLCAVARVSRLMQSEAECLMYREVEMGQKDSTRTIISILRRLAHSVVVPLYVRRFALVISWQRQAECRFLSFFHLLFQVLERMTRLQSLTLRIDTTHIQASIFCRCTFKLSVLDIDYLDKALVTFLESQPEIRILRVAEGLDEEVLLNSPYFLPNLAVLAAGRRNATLLIPGRPVTHVWLSPFELQSLDRLALSSRPVLALGTIFYWKPEAGQPLNSIVHIARVAPDLEALHILLVTRISDTIEAKSAFMECVVSRFKKLRRLDLYLGRFTTTDKDADDILVHKLQDLRPSLRVITLASLNAEDSWIWTWTSRQRGVISWKQIKPYALFWDEAASAIGIPQSYVQSLSS